MKQSSENKKEMNYVTNSSFSFENQAASWGEKMESATLFTEQYPFYANRGDSSTDGDHQHYTKYVAEDVSYMADFDFSATGEILAVHYTPVSSKQALWHRNL